MTTILETCRIAPPPGSVVEQSLPLTFFDLNWLHFHPMRSLHFYDFPCSKPYFLETVVPKLKESLSAALKHYFPLAGSLAYPLDTQEKKPVIRCAQGDSVCVTIAVSEHDFDNLVGNHARDADQFYDFVPDLPPMLDEPDCKLLPQQAVKVTLFPGRGICIGFSNQHTVADAVSIFAFITCWADICKLGGEEEYLNRQDKCLPVFDRSMINEPPWLNSFSWNVKKKTSLQYSSPFPLPTNRVRATYVFGPSQIKKLKDLLLARKPGLVHVSSFVVAVAFVRTCFAKSLVAAGEEEVDADAEDFFVFAIDGRPLLDPPVPGNYFGNCVVPGVVKIRHQELVGEEGFFAAAEAIAIEIYERVHSKKQLLIDADKWKAKLDYAKQKSILMVAGSNKVDMCSPDFGWGRTRKMEILSIDGQKHAITLCQSRDPEARLEIGLSLPKIQMDAFAASFAELFKD